MKASKTDGSWNNGMNDLHQQVSPLAGEPMGPTS